MIKAIAINNKQEGLGRQVDVYQYLIPLDTVRGMLKKLIENYFSIDFL